MGTNYYWRADERDESIHIGKSSAGWCFALHVTEELTSLDDWVAEWGKPGYIQDEYGTRHTPEQMFKVITNRRWHRPDLLSWRVDGRNNAVKGPNGLLRSRIDNEHCTGHGEGTWDLHPGKFS